MPLSNLMQCKIDWPEVNNVFLFSKPDHFGTGKSGCGYCVWQELELDSISESIFSYFTCFVDVRQVYGNSFLLF